MDAMYIKNNDAEIVSHDGISACPLSTPEEALMHAWGDTDLFLEAAEAYPGGYDAVLALLSTSEPVHHDWGLRVLLDAYESPGLLCDYLMYSMVHPSALLLQIRGGDSREFRRKPSRFLQYCLDYFDAVWAYSVSDNPHIPLGWVFDQMLEALGNTLFDPSTFMKSEEKSLLIPILASAQETFYQYPILSRRCQILTEKLEGQWEGEGEDKKTLLTFVTTDSYDDVQLFTMETVEYFLEFVEIVGFEKVLYWLTGFREFFGSTHQYCLDMLCCEFGAETVLNTIMDVGGRYSNITPIALQLGSGMSMVTSGRIWSYCTLDAGNTGSGARKTLLTLLKSRVLHRPPAYLVPQILEFCSELKNGDELLGYIQKIT